jgi:predicted O-methyltransferase YrrM
MPPLRRLLDERDHLFFENAMLKTKFGAQVPYVPNGHFYSPIPSVQEIQENEKTIFATPPVNVPGIDLRASSQRQLLEEFAELYTELPFPEQQRSDIRYWYDNASYSYSDAIFLFCMIRHAKPKRIVEIGSGYSSCAMLDTNERFFSNSISCTFIEPYPKLLHSLLRPGDVDSIEVIPRRVQDVEISVFQQLSAGDILFVDSTHVSKTGSDVNRIFFEILPVLASGVYIHFHDIFYPFEYPKAWVYEGRAWNEAYMLRAFLQYNTSFPVVCFNTFLEHTFPEFFETRMPLCLKNLGGSIWLQKR